MWEPASTGTRRIITPAGTLKPSQPHACCLPCLPAVGVFPFKTVMTAGKLKMGYVEVLTGESAGDLKRLVRGQVFHYSEIVQASSPTGRAAFAAAAILPLLLVVTPAVELGREDG